MADKATIEIKGDNKPLARDLAEAKSMLMAWAGQVSSGLGSVLGKLTNIFGGVGPMAGLAAILAGLAVQIASIRKALHSAQDAEPIWVKLNALLISTGHAAGFTLEQIKDLAKEIQELTTFEDEAAASAATVLLKFRSIKGDLFKDAMKASADLATLLGSDLSTAARMLGRALEEPSRGMMMLRRAGIVLNEQEKQQIKTLIEQNKLREAQEILLKRVNAVVGGQAAAAANTASGAWQQLSNAVSDLWETLGEDLLPAVREFVKFLVQVVNGLTVWAEKTKFVRDAIGNVIAAVFKAAQLIITALLPAFKDTADFMENIFKPAIMAVSDFLIEKLADWTAGFLNFRDATISALDELLMFFLVAFKKMADVADSLFGGITSQFKDMSKGLDKNLQTVAADYMKRQMAMIERRRKVEQELRGAGQSDTERARPEGAMAGSGDGSGGDKLAGTFEGIEELYKRISSASGGTPAADRTAEAAEEMVDGVEDAVAAIEKNEEQLAVLNSKMDVLIGKLPAAGVLANA